MGVLLQREKGRRGAIRGTEGEEEEEEGEWSLSALLPRGATKSKQAALYFFVVLFFFQWLFFFFLLLLRQGHADPHQRDWKNVVCQQRMHLVVAVEYPRPAPVNDAL